jgi:hypothetical protein
VFNRITRSFSFDDLLIFTTLIIVISGLLLICAPSLRSHTHDFRLVLKFLNLFISFLNFFWHIIISVNLRVFKDSIKLPILLFVFIYLNKDLVFRIWPFLERIDIIRLRFHFIVHEFIHIFLRRISHPSALTLNR